VKETAALTLQSGWYYCDGSNKNRVTDASLFNAITIRQNGTLTSGSTVVTGLSDTSNGGSTPISPGMPVSGTGISVGTVVQSVDSSTQVTLSQTATSTATTLLVFAPYGVGDGITTFGLPNRAYIAVGRDNASGSASNVLQLSSNLSLTSGSTTATVGSAAGLAIGMYVSHPNVPNGTKINAISGTTLTLSANASATTSSTGRFSPILDAQTLGALGGELSHVTSVPEMAAHTHANTLADPGHVHGCATSAGGASTGVARVATGINGNVSTGGTTIIGMQSDGTNSFLATATTGITITNVSTGGGLAHNNHPKSIVMNFIIKR
jgi:microcystin-dependent protein